MFSILRLNVCLVGARRDKEELRKAIGKAHGRARKRQGNTSPIEMDSFGLFSVPSCVLSSPLDFDGSNFQLVKVE